MCSPWQNGKTESLSFGRRQGFPADGLLFGAVNPVLGGYALIFSCKSTTIKTIADVIAITYFIGRNPYETDHFEY